jgi:hypothetical protein
MLRTTCGRIKSDVIMWPQSIRQPMPQSIVATVLSVSREAGQQFVSLWCESYDLC